MHERVAVSLPEYAPRDASAVNGVTNSMTGARSDAAILYSQPRVTDATGDVCISCTDGHKPTTQNKHRGRISRPETRHRPIDRTAAAPPARFGPGFSRGNGNSHLFTVSRTVEYGHCRPGPRPLERRADTDCYRIRRYWWTRQDTQYVSDVVDISGAVLTDGGRQLDSHHQLIGSAVTEAAIHGSRGALVRRRFADGVSAHREG